MNLKTRNLNLRMIGNLISKANKSGNRIVVIRVLLHGFEKNYHRPFQHTEEIKKVEKSLCQIL